MNHPRFGAGARVFSCLLFLSFAVAPQPAKALQSAQQTPAGQPRPSSTVANSKQANEESPKQSTPNRARSNQGGANRQLVEMSRVAAGESANSNESTQQVEKDETSEFKESSSVRRLAKITGMNVRQASWLGVLFNFGVLVGAIVWFSVKGLPKIFNGLPKMFRNRTASIQQAMAEARKASEDARRRLGDIEARLTHLDSEIGKITASAEKEAVLEEERMKAATAEDVRRVVESAEQEIASAAKNARRELTKYAADLAVSLAEKQIHVDPATDQQLVRGFSDQLSNGSRSKQ
ncbi:MAG TPA: ATP synthase F0 subunit B [Terriglobales bacterium]|jgi:F-type H+-transporting ATPase subunit b